MTKLVVCGASGRMGARILQLAESDRAITIVGAVESATHPSLGDTVAGVRIQDDLGAVVDTADVVVDFTTPSASLEHADLAARSGKALVIGTTGFEHDEVTRLRKLVAPVPCVFTPNMSVGVTVLFALLKMAVRSLPGFDAEIVEIHHNQKKDAPSGTAIRLAGLLAQELKRDLGKSGTFGRKGVVGARRKDEIGLHAVRGGDVVGEHTVYLFGPGERLELTHRAHNRDTFAVGALTAARWVVRQKPGFYDMRHVLGLE